MKLVLLSAVILLAGNVALAEREDPLEIFAQLKRATKLFSGASDLLASGQREVLLTEESYVQTALNDEAELLNQLTGSDVQRNGPQCVEFIRTNVNLLMSLAGIAYTNCLNEVDEALFSKLSETTQTLSRDQYDQLNLLAVFRGENIFADPAKIRQKLANWQQTRTELSPEVTTSALTAATFDELKTAFRACMATAQSRLADNLNFTAQQVRAICAKQV
ncbi:hypothetical protein quinque_010352 [Culex quinquefasciatus]|uniref:uncharacterized protein LOC6031349 n=1 Tax=Culex quinquefasciatus TaxID=7176 RepID=UPI0018E2C81A|nr:uncharacterized protein LOC6031349 [Culex quinquefasciatus]XP_039430498.1 uncharacterized protein LOC120413649 [Culex pipiens pallens]